MEENKKRNNTPIIIILVILLLACVGAGVYGYLNRDNDNNKNNNVTDKDTTNDNNNQSSETNDNQGTENNNNNQNESNNTVTKNNFDVVKVDNLNTKISSLNFDNKTSDEIVEEDFLTVKANINDGKVTVNLNITEGGSTIERSYTVSSITDAKGVGTGISVEGNGFAVIYILTNSGKVYRIEDEIGEVKTNANYLGTAKDMLIEEAVEMTTVNELFSLRDNAETITPTVYIKTKDGRFFTDEPINDQQGLIEVVEK